MTVSPSLFQYRFRVQYSDVDRMTFAHHSKFLVYFENARTELLRAMGESYLHWEERGFMIPVLDCQIDFLQPAHYDDELLITVELIQVTRLRLRFRYQVTRGESVIARGETGHAFMTSDSHRPRRITAEMAAKFEDYAREGTTSFGGACPS